MHALTPLVVATIPPIGNTIRMTFLLLQASFFTRNLNINGKRLTLNIWVSIISGYQWYNVRLHHRLHVHGDNLDD